MILWLLALLGLVFILTAALLTAAEAALTFIPHHEAEQISSRPDGARLAKIRADAVAHLHALRFWRIWFEMAAAVAVAILFHDLLDNIWLAGLLATAIMAGIGFVLVGVSPRQFGRLHAVPTVRLTAGLVRVLRMMLGPLPGVLVRIGGAVTPNAQAAEASLFTEDEFRELVSRANEADVIEDSEASLIHSVFDLGDTRVRAVMVPRTDMFTVESGTGLRQAMTLFLRSGYSRIPVILDSADQIVGIVYLKDVAALLHNDPASAATVDSICRDVRYVPESKSVSSLLQELQRESTHVAIVIDEYGGTAGLVTLEDLIEEIVGEIVDEYDSERPEIEPLGGGRYRVSAKTSIDDLGDLFGLELEDDEVDTVGGLLAKSLGRVPIVGSEVEINGIRLHAERLEGRRNRVSHVVAWFEPAHSDGDSAGSEAPPAHADYGSKGRLDAGEDAAPHTHGIDNHGSDKYGADKYSVDKYGTDKYRPGKNGHPRSPEADPQKAQA